MSFTAELGWFESVFTDLVIFHDVPFLIEPMFPEWIQVGVCLVIFIAIGALEWMQTWFTFFFSRWGGLVFSFTLQHHPNWQWFSDLWGPLHLIHLEPWIQQDIVTCPYHQQFLHWGTPEFMLAPRMVAIYFSMLKHLLIKPLALLPLWTFYISI